LKEIPGKKIASQQENLLLLAGIKYMLAGQFKKLAERQLKKLAEHHLR
jgi:hypothetical protein